MPHPGLQELLVIGGILVLLFGATKLPALGRGMAEALKYLKSGLEELRAPDKRERKPEQ